MNDHPIVTTRVSLEQLEQQMADLVQWRNETLAVYKARLTDIQEYINQVNAEFDQKAVLLQRQIDELQPAPERTKTIKPPPEPDPEWSDEDARHYLELVTQVTRNK